MLNGKLNPNYFNMNVAQWKKHLRWGENANKYSCSKAQNVKKSYWQYVGIISTLLGYVNGFCSEGKFINSINFFFAFLCQTIFKASVTANIIEIHLKWFFFVSSFNPKPYLDDPQNRKFNRFGLYSQLFCCCVLSERDNLIVAVLIKSLLC